MKSPAFQFYSNDFLGGTVATYSLEEVGAYMTLLAFDWSLTGLPVEPEKLARLLRVSRRKFDALWTVVGEQFRESEGRYFNRRLELERAKQASWREKSAKGGRNHGTKGGSRVVEANPQPNGNTPSSSSTPVVAKQHKEPKGASPALVKTRPPRPPAPWMGRMQSAWSFGTLPPGTATLLQPVVVAVGEDEAVERLGNYCGATEARFASVRDFVAKHAAHSGEGRVAVDEHGMLNDIGIAALGGRR